MSLLTKEMKEMVESQQCFHATISKDGIPNSAEMSFQAGMPKPKAVVLVKIDEIQSLKPGPLAGKKIG